MHLFPHGWYHVDVGLHYIIVFELICRLCHMFFTFGESLNGGSQMGLRPFSATRALSSAIVHICGLLGPSVI